MDHHVENDRVFLTAVKLHDLKSAQWIYSLGGVDVSVLDSRVFIIIGTHECFELFQWVLSLEGVHVPVDEIFSPCCRSDCADERIVEQLLQTGGSESVLHGYRSMLVIKQEKSKECT